MLLANHDVAFETLRPFFTTHPQAKENRLHAAKESFKWFFYLYLSHYLTVPPAEFQLEEFELAKKPRLLIVEPRGYGKSVKWSIGYPLWVVLNNPYNTISKWQREDIFCLSNTGLLAEKWIRYHKRELTENVRIVADYNVEQGEIWRQDEIEVKVGGKLHGRILARGSGAQIRGEHPTEVVIDDLENREEVKSESIREKTREYFYQDVWGSFRHEVGKETRCKIIGNMVSPLCLLNELSGKDWWEKRIYSILKADGTPLWPEYHNIEKLDELREQSGESAWWAEYMNQPITSENPTFVREWFNKYEPGMIRDSSGKKIALRDMLIVTAIDPAISTREGADHTAITTYGVTWDEKDPKIYCLDARRGHWTTSKQITELLACYERFPGSVQIIETVAYQKALYNEYKDRLDRERLDIKVIDVIPDKDKGRRANAITPLFQRGLVHFDHDDRNQRVVMDQLAMFDYSVRKSSADDYVDSTVYCLDYIDQWLRRRKRGGKDKKKPNIMYSPTSPVYGNPAA